MKKYRVNIKRIEYGFVEVTAEDKQEATNRASMLEAEGMATWGKEETEIEDVEEIEISMKKLTKKEHKELHCKPNNPHLNNPSFCCNAEMTREGICLNCGDNGKQK